MPLHQQCRFVFDVQPPLPPSDRHGRVGWSKAHLCTRSAGSRRWRRARWARGGPPGLGSSPRVPSSRRSIQACSRLGPSSRRLLHLGRESRAMRLATLVPAEANRAIRTRSVYSCRRSSTASHQASHRSPARRSRKATAHAAASLGHGHTLEMRVSESEPDSRYVTDGELSPHARPREG